MAAMDLLSLTGDSLVLAFQNIWFEFLRVIPGLIAALIIIIIGIIVARIIRKIVEKVLEGSKIDDWIADHKLSSAIGNSRLSKIIGMLVKWYVIVLFLAQAMDLVSMKVLNAFLQKIVTYLPILLTAVFLFILGLLIAKYIRLLIEKTGHKYRRTVGIVGEVLVVYVALVASLQIAGFQVTILSDILIEIVRAFAMALAIVIAIVTGLFFVVAYWKELMSLAENVKKKMKTAKK